MIECDWRNQWGLTIEIFYYLNGRNVVECCLQVSITEVTTVAVVWRMEIILNL